jgi:hypothetical protein
MTKKCFDPQASYCRMKLAQLARERGLWWAKAPITIDRWIGDFGTYF